MGLFFFFSPPHIRALCSSQELPNFFSSQACLRKEEQGDGHRPFSFFFRSAAANDDEQPPQIFFSTEMVMRI